MSIDQTTTTTSTTDDRPSDAPTTSPGPSGAAPHAAASAPTRAPAPAPAQKPGTTFESLAVAGLVFGIFAMVIAVFAVGLAARAVSDSKSGGGGAASTAPATLDVTLADFSIKPNKAEIASGGDITLENKGAMDHDLRIENEKSALIAPGKKGDLQLKSLPPGTYTMYCDVPGHRAAGMEGTIVVK